MSLRAVRAAAVVQWHTSVRAPEHLLVLAVAPLFTVVFLSVVRATGRPDLVVNAVLGTGLLGIWFVAVNVAGGVVQNERWMDTLDLVLAAPTAFAYVVCGRILPTMVIGAATLAESWLVVSVLFRVDLPVRHPLLALLALVVTLLATACTATVLAALFVLTRNTEVVQNTLSYPCYILGGVVVPLSALPDWVQVVGRVFYLSWSADLLRDSITAELVVGFAWRLGLIAAMGAVALALGVVLIGRAADRVRRTGEVSVA